MKLGIAKIETIDVLNTIDFSYFSTGSTFTLKPFLKSEMEKIIFTDETATFEETWSDETGGPLSTAIIEGISRVQTIAFAQSLLRRIYQDQILKITLKNGLVMIVGSNMFPCRFTLVSSIAGPLTSDKIFTFTCKSPHGVYYAKD